MNETPHDADSNASQTPGDRRGLRRHGALPWWLWAFLAAILVVILVIIAIPLLSGNDSQVVPSRTPSASPSPTQNTPPTPTPIPTQPAADVGQGTFDSSMFANMSDVLNSQNTAVLSQGGTFSDPVAVVTANSGQIVNMTPDDAVNSMSSMFTFEDPNPWDLALTDSMLTTYRSGPFGQYFPDGAIVARSHDGHVFSFIGHGKTITTMFMATSEDLLH